MGERSDRGGRRRQPGPAPRHRAAEGGPGLRPDLRRLRPPAERLARVGLGRLGFRHRRRRAATPELAAEIAATLADSAGAITPAIACRSGASFSAGRSDSRARKHDLPLRLFRRGCGNWVGDVHETVKPRGTAGHLPGIHPTSNHPRHAHVSPQDRQYTTLEARLNSPRGRPFRIVDDLTIRPLWTSPSSISASGDFATASKDSLLRFRACLSRSANGSSRVAAGRVDPLENVHSAILALTRGIEQARRFTP